MYHGNNRCQRSSTHILTMLRQLFLVSALLPVILTLGLHSTYKAKSKAGITYTVTTVSISPHRSYEDNTVAQIYEKNLNLYKNAIPSNIQEHHIVIYPEYGLTGIHVEDNRTLAVDFAQEFTLSPEPKVIPCDTFGTEPTENTMRQLSCLAKQNGVYLVANVLEREECDPEVHQCRPDNLRIFSTTVAFNKDGSLTNRYRKYNRYTRNALDIEEFKRASDSSVLTTDFGVNFGLMSAFDFFSDQPMSVYKEQDIHEIISPFSWAGELPFLTPLQIQYGWSKSTQLNLINACYETPSLGQTGCGVYTTLGDAFSIIDGDSVGSQAITLNITSIETNPTRNKSPQSTISINFIKSSMSGFVSIPLNLTEDLNNFQLCYNNEFCCDFEYKFKVIPEVVNYKLVIYDGLKFNTDDNTAWDVQVCGLVACSGEDISTCSDPPEMSNYTLDTTFEVFKIVGDFKNEYVLPSTLYNDFLPISEIELKKELNVNGNYTFTLQLNERTTEIKNVHTFALHSYDFFKAYYFVNKSSHVLASSFLITCAIFINFKYFY